MKTLHFITLFIFTTICAQSQTLDMAGSAATVGGAHQFYYDSVDDLTYTAGSITSAEGQDQNWVIGWNGSAWVNKGNIIRDITSPAIDNGSMVRSDGILYVVGPRDDAGFTHLYYWSDNTSDWELTNYAFTWEDTPIKLLDYNNELYVTGGSGHGRIVGNDNTEYGEVGKWDGTQFVTTNCPTTTGFDEVEANSIVWNGKIYAAHNCYDGNTWDTYGLDSTDFYYISDIDVYDDELIIARTYNQRTDIISFDGTDFSDIVAQMPDPVESMVVSAGNKLCVKGYQNNTNTVGLYDGTSWTQTVAFMGAINVLGDYNGQLIMGGEDGAAVWHGVTFTPLGSVITWGTPITTSMSNDKMTSESSIFPNPVVDNTITINNEGNYKVSIYNIQGSLIYSSNELSGNKVINLKSNITSGIYMLNIISATNIETHKLIIK